MSVTSSGRSSISSTMTNASGWLAVMALAIFCMRMVFPVLGGETIRPRCPLPMGQKRLMILVEISSVTVSRLSFSSGYSGVRLSNGILVWATSGGSKFTVSTRSMAKNRSPSLGDLICPATVSPVFRLNRRVSATGKCRYHPVREGSCSWETAGTRTRREGSPARRRRRLRRPSPCGLSGSGK